MPQPAFVSAELYRLVQLTWAEKPVCWGPLCTLLFRFLFSLAFCVREP
jgi:hypothetical protein